MWPNSKRYALHHRAWTHISMAYTHMLRVSSTADVLQHSTMSEHRGICLHCTHTCHTYHRTSRLHLSLHETGDPCPHPVGGGGRGAVTMQVGVADSHKSHLLRILHKKLRWRRINSQFGSALVKPSLWAPVNPISMIPVQTETYSISRRLPGDDTAKAPGVLNKQAGDCFTSAGVKIRDLIAAFSWEISAKTQGYFCKGDERHYAPEKKGFPWLSSCWDAW